MRESFVRGVRLGIPYAVVGFVLSLSFGVVARQAGFSPGQAIAASAFVFAGSAQFAALAVFAAGGTLDRGGRRGGDDERPLPGHGRRPRPVAARRPR